jgi:aspartyl-tRNA synthetase
MFATGLICEEQSIRYVMAFLQSNYGLDSMTNSPANVDPRQLRGTQARNCQ